MRRRTVLSMEQALALPYATLRFAQLGWRVIRIETASEGPQPGDPNRYIGSPIEGMEHFSYFIAPNVGKEAIALNLKTEEGRAVLQQLLRKLDVDVFCCNTIPSRYEALGIDYPTLSRVKPGLIWAGISAMGPDYPDVAGYDPVMQAMVGYMEVTGFPENPPTLSGIPLIDLKAGDEVYANVLLALAERGEDGMGRRIDVSMLRAAASWLITLLPLIDLGCGPEEITRWGNAHRKFIPTNVYPTADGYVYVGFGSNAMWRRFTASAMFASLAAGGRRDTAQARYEEREIIYREIAEITRRHKLQEVAAVLSAAQIPNTVIQDIRQVHAMEAVRRCMTETVLPNGARIRMQPMAVELGRGTERLSPPPRYGEHSEVVLREAGYTDEQFNQLKRSGVVA